MRFYVAAYLAICADVLRAEADLLSMASRKVARL